MRIRVLIVGAIIVALAGGILAVRARDGVSSPASQPAQVAPVAVTVFPRNEATS